MLQHLLRLHGDVCLHHHHRTSSFFFLPTKYDSSSSSKGLFSVRVLIFLRVAQIQNHRERVAVRDVLPVRSARIGRQKMPLVRNDENVETVVQIENSRRGLVQTMLPDRTGRAATQDVHRVLEPNDEWTLVQEQVVAEWRFVQQLLREGV